MRAWAQALGGLLIWALHFFGVYIAASLFPAETIARGLVLGLTGAGLAGCIALLVQAVRRFKVRRDDFTTWQAGLSVGSYLVGALAIAYQGLPALLV